MWEIWRSRSDRGTSPDQLVIAMEQVAKASVCVLAIKCQGDLPIRLVREVFIIGDAEVEDSAN